MTTLVLYYPLWAWLRLARGNFEQRSCKNYRYFLHRTSKNLLC